MATKEPVLMALARSGGDHFAFNNLLEFLNLQEIVQLLFLLRRCEPSFVPVPSLLQELIELSLRHRQQDESDIHPNLTFCPSETMPSLSFCKDVEGVKIVDKKLTIRTLRCLYDFVRHIENEYQPSLNIEVRDGKICMIASRSDVMTSDVETTAAGWQATIGFPCSQCSNDECNQVVLWDCPLCKNVCTDCMACVTVCNECEERVCNGCSLTHDELTVCKDCGFVCVDCGEFCLDSEQERIECGGTRRGVQCTRHPGPHCLGCAMNRMIIRCPKCEKVSCFDCNPTTFCSECFDFCCMDCHGMYFCDKCCNFYCWYPKGCKNPQMCMEGYAFRCEDCHSDSMIWCDDASQMLCDKCENKQSENK